MKTILLIDDHFLFGDALSSLLRRHWSKLTLIQAEDVYGAFELLARHPQTLLALLALGPPGGDGLGKLARWCERAPQLPTYALAADDRPQTLAAVRQAGAVGLISKTMRGSLLVELLEQAFARDDRSSEPSGHKSQPGNSPGSTDEAPFGLEISPRQLSVLRLLTEGKSNRQICNALGLSESTVKTHLRAVFLHLNVSTRTQAAVAAARLGLISSPV